MNQKFISIPLFVFSAIFLISGCDSQKEKIRIQEGKSFLYEFLSIRNKSFHENISPGSSTKAHDSDEVSYLHIQYPIDDLAKAGIDIPDYDAVTTLQDVERIVLEYGANLEITTESMNQDGLIAVSKRKVQTALQPMIQQSKKYLYSLGLSDIDIAEMLEETDTNESSLIPFTIALVESDIHYLAMKHFSRFSLTHNAYAKLTWGDAGNCALSALGVDVVMALNRSGAKAMTKAAMKAALKSVAKRCVGYIGVAIFVVEFGICLGTSA